jgi:hypothetical protein
LCLLTRRNRFDAVDQPIFDGLGVDPEHKPVIYIGIHIVKNVCLSLSFLEWTIESCLDLELTVVKMSIWFGLVLTFMYREYLFLVAKSYAELDKATRELALTLMRRRKDEVT